jgi:hypothetical protein
MSSTMDREKPDKPREPAEPAPDVAPRDDVRIAASPVRCPYCHDGVAPEAPDPLVCRSCLARHHEPCWKESLRCGACGHAQALTRAVEFVAVERPAQHVANERPWARRAWWILTALMIPTTLLFVVLGIKEGEWSLLAMVVASFLTWLGYGLGWFSKARVRRVEERPTDGPR